MNKIKTSVKEDLYVFNLNGFDINFCKVENPSTRASLWNIMGIYKNDEVICTKGTDILGVLHEKDQLDFMGGVHGDETNVNLLVLADGKIIEGDCESNRVDIIMYSHLTRVSTGEHILDRFVHVELENSSITVTTTFKCLCDSFELDIAFNGGMFAWREAMAEYQFTNAGPIIPENTKTAVTLQKDKSIHKAVCKLPNAFIAVENIIGNSNPSYIGKAFYYGNEENPRIKIYFSTDEKCIWNNGHVCTGKAKYTLL